ncbi:MAG: site-specific integrase, partial [Methanobacteriaceae archaeon]|nr:site-specific integrase [Methanobacteriaceae archaeon]
MNINQAISEYINTIEINEGKSLNTIKSYSRDLNIYSKFLNNKKIDNIKKIDSSIVNDFLSSISSKYSTNSINRIKTSVKSFHQYINFKYEIKDPTVNIEVHKAV